MAIMIDNVECYSGSAYDERPMALTWQGKRYTIRKILSQGRTPLVKWFQVQIDAGDLFELSYNEAAEDSSCENEWQVTKI
jgi:hypothetical protein